MITIIQHRHGEGSVPIDDGSQQIVFVDPPYNIGVCYQDDPTWDSIGEMGYWNWMEGVVRDLARVLRIGGTFWWLAPAGHVGKIPGILSRLVGEQLYLIIKQETFAQYQSKKLTEDYRILFCYQKTAVDAVGVFNPDAIRIPSARQVGGDKRADPRGRVPGQIWDFRRLQGTSVDRVAWHPCQLPPELLIRILLGWSHPGDSVLDGFAGSGSMGIAAARTGRSAVLVDGSVTYCDLMKRRLLLWRSDAFG